MDIKEKDNEKALRAAVLRAVTDIPDAGFDGADINAGDVSRMAKNISQGIASTVSRVVREKQAEVGVDDQAVDNFEVSDRVQIGHRRDIDTNVGIHSLSPKNFRTWHKLSRALHSKERSGETQSGETKLSPQLQLAKFL